MLAAAVDIPVKVLWIACERLVDKKE